MITFSDFKYPYFKKGQVLKNTDLNYMVDYLDEQNRLTRVLVVGSGIFTGLEISFNSSGSGEDYVASLGVSSGFGISSDGYIIRLQSDNGNSEYLYYKTRSFPKSSFTCSTDTDSDDADNITVYELFQDTSEIANDEEIKPLKDLIDDQEEPNTNYCLLLWISQELKDRPYCIDVCDDNGSDLDFSIRALLVKQEDLDIDDESSTDSSSMFGLPPEININPFGYFQEEVYVPGVDQAQEIAVVKPSLISSFEDFMSNYSYVIEEAIKDGGTISEAFNYAFEQMELLGLATGESPFVNLSSQLNQLLSIYSTPILETGATPQNIDIQYFYQYIQDLKKAYEEFIEALFKIKRSGLPDICAYPRYLSLGNVIVKDSGTLVPFELTGDWRTAFQPSLFNGVSSSLLNQIEFLFNRMISLTSLSLNGTAGSVQLPVNLSEKAIVKVIPDDVRSSQLSKYTIPVYYNTDIKTGWCYEYSQQTESKLTGYNFLDLDKTWAQQNPILFHDNSHNFYRVEGHIGQQTEDVYSALNFWIETYNLPFSVKYVFFDFLENGDITYLNPEMQTLQDKYTEVRGIAIDDSELGDGLEDVLPEKLADFICDDLVKHFGLMDNYHHYHYSECLIDTLQTLKVLYDLQAEGFEDLFAFSEFASAHPGLKHQGGVPEGGTFVIVSAMPYTSEIGYLLEGSAQLKANAALQKLLTIDNAKLKQLIEANSSQVVVADFALPYSCCDHKPIEPLIIVSPTQFCSGDMKAYEIWTYPSGGRLESSLGDPLSDVNNLPDYITYDAISNRFLLHPHAVPIDSGLSSEFSLVYRLGGFSSSAQLTIYKQVDEVDTPVDITIGAVQPQYLDHELTGFEIELQTTYPNSELVSWEIDGVNIGKDGQTSFTESFNLTNTLYEINLIIENGVCIFKKEFILNLCSLLGNLQLEFKGLAQFSETPEADEELEIEVSPVGGSFIIQNDKGEGFNEDIKYVVALPTDDGQQVTGYKLMNWMNSPLPVGQYTLIYYFPDCSKVATHKFYVQNDPEIIMNRDVFCGEDDHEYVINFYPPEAKLTANPPENIRYTNGLYIFQPSIVPDTNYIDGISTTTIRCEVNENLVVEKTIRAYQLPDEIVVKDGPKAVYNPQTCKMEGFKFALGLIDGLVPDVYQWRLNGSYVSSANETEITIDLESDENLVELVVVKHLESEEYDEKYTCQKVVSYDLKNACSLLEDIISIEMRAESTDEGVLYKFKVNPAGGRFYITPEDSDEKLAELTFDLNSDIPCDEQNEFEITAIELVREYKLDQKLRYRILYEIIDPCAQAFTVPFQPDTSVPDATTDSPTNITNTTATTSTTVSASAVTETVNVAKLLNKRAKGRAEVLTALESDASLASSKTYKVAKLFTINAGDVSTLLAEYETVSAGLFTRLKSANDVRKEQYLSLLKVITQSLLDRILVENTASLSSDVLTALAKIKADMKENSISVSTIMDGWLTEDLTLAFNSDVVLKVTDILK